MPRKKRSNAATLRFGEILRRLRLERGWSIAMLAHRLKISASYVGILEKGGNMLSFEMLFELAEVFDVSAWEIVREFEFPEHPAIPHSERAAPSQDSLP